MQTFKSRGKPVGIGQEIANEALKASPPAGVLAYNVANPPPVLITVLGLSLNDWLIVVGISWIAIQAVVFIHKYIVWWKAGKPVKEK